MGKYVLFRGVDKILEGFIGEESGKVGMLHNRDVWVWFESNMVRHWVIQGWGTIGLVLHGFYTVWGLPFGEAICCKEFVGM